MIKKVVIKMMVIAVFLITTSVPVMAKAPIDTQPVKKVLSTQEIIEKTALQFNQDPQLISKISLCESGHKVRSHDGGRGVNMTGIHDSTFRSWLPRYEQQVGETLDIQSTYDQFKMMSWAFSQGENYRDDWTTYVAYTRGGTYSFYSRLLQDHFTVHCK